MSLSFDFSLDNVRPAYAYHRLLEEMREALDARPQNSNLPLPMLAQEEDRPRRLFDVRLRTLRYSVTFRLRADNLYLLGYRLGNDNEWLEFGIQRRNPIHLIDNSQFLHFGGSYSEMENAGGEGAVSLSSAELGLRCLRESLETLSNSGTEDSQQARRQRARALLPVIVMVCESTRFRSVAQHVFHNFHQGSETPLPTNLQRQVNNWGDLSLEVLRAYLANSNNFSCPEGTDLQDCEAAVIALGLLKDCTARLNQRHRRPRSIDEDVWVPGDGQPLVEILWVTINSGEDPCNLYGTITVTDRLGSQFIYQRDSSNRQDVPLGQEIPLTGPSRCISALDSFNIDFNLKDWDFFSSDDEVGRGRISWNVYDTAWNGYNEPVAGNVSGEDGSVSLNYVVLTNAVQAMVEITLVEGDDLFWDNVYGIIKATNKGGFEFDVLLFDRESDDYVNLSSKEKFPLLRSAVPVQLNDSLIIQARLYDQDTLSRDDEIANGRATFPAQPHGITEEDITGSYGKIKVKVSWSRV